MKHVGGRSLISFYEIFYQILKVVYSFLWPLFMNQLLILIDPPRHQRPRKILYVLIFIGTPKFRK